MTVMLDAFPNRSRPFLSRGVGGWVSLSNEVDVIKVYGASDDLVEIEGDVRDEIGCFEAGASVTIGDKTGGLRIVAKYAPGKTGTWRLGVEPIDEDVPLPWPVRVEQTERGYSLAVVVDCPPGTPVTLAKLRKAACP